MSIEVKLVENDIEQQACFDIRTEVFVGEQNVAPEIEFDGEDGECSQVLALLNGKPAGTARYRMKGGAIKVQRVAVLNSARGSGLGVAIMQFIIDAVQAEGRADSMVLDAQIQALPFYEKLGFQAHGEEFLDANIPHLKMTLRLN